MSLTSHTNVSEIQVYKTKDYNQFKILEGNRYINNPHLTRLKASIEDQYLVTIIIVNENGEVIDGQHRLEIIMQLKLYVYYIVCKDYGLEQIHKYNANSKTWTMDDYMLGYIELGNKNYITYKEFKDKYGFAHNACLTLLMGYDDSRISKAFQLGKLRIKDLKEAYRKAEKIASIQPYFLKWKSRSFVRAVLNLMSSEVFIMEEFIKKLKYQQSKLVECQKAEQYIPLIEEIYNYKRLRSELVSFNYAKAS